MKKIIIAILVIILLAIIALVVVFRMTSGITEVADQFLTAVKQGNLLKAYGYTSREFQATTSLQDLAEFLNDSALMDFSTSSWSSRSISGNQGNLEGSVKTRGGGTIPIKMSFVKEQAG